MIGDSTVVGRWVARAGVVVVHLIGNSRDVEKAEKEGKLVMGFGQIGSKRLLGIVMVRMTSGAVESLLVVCLTAVSKDPAALGAARVTVSLRHSSRYVPRRSSHSSHFSKSPMMYASSPCRSGGSNNSGLLRWQR